MDEAEHCQDLAFIHQGRIIAHGAPEEIKVNTMEGEVMEVDSDQPDRAIKTLQGMGLFEEVALYGALIHVVGDDVASHEEEIRRRLREADVDVRAMDLIAPSLEDVFIANVRQNGESRE
jgi:ABC-2 type transport system ATP-binding protein